MEIEHVETKTITFLIKYRNMFYQQKICQDDVDHLGNGREDLSREISRDSNRFDFNEKSRTMNEQHHPRTTWYSSFTSSPVRRIASKELENFSAQTSVQHSFTDNYHHSKRKRREQSNKSLLLISIHRILLLLVRLMILFLIILFVSWIFYSTLMSISSFKQKKKTCQEILHWLLEE